MRTVMKATAKRREGVSLVEVIFLLIVLSITLGAVFSTMAWAARSYAFGKQDKQSREVLFSWVQTFESMWPTAAYRANPGSWSSEARGQIQEVGRMMGTWDGASNGARIGGYLVTATPSAPSTGKMDLTITISTGNKTWVEIRRSYNVYSCDTVSDDVLVRGS